jgi:hypothetical protein
VERKNRTLLDMARTMLDEYKTSDRFWAEAINTACYAINRLYLHRIIKKISYELLTGKKPNVSYFRVFGSCWRFELGGSLDRRVNCRRVPQPRWVGARQSAKRGREAGGRQAYKGETRGLCVCPAPRSGALAVGGYKRPRGRERAASRERRPVLPRTANPL